MTPPSSTRPAMRRISLFMLASLVIALAGCASKVSLQPQEPAAPLAGATPAAKAPSRPLPVLPPAGSGRGGYYQDDGPGDAPPEGLLELADAEPKIEPIGKRGNRPYVVFGKTYTPFTDDRPFRQTGIGSWYGRKFHGQKTSSGELYDMYQMTAAHPTLPLPSYARVTNRNNGKQVIVRVNDRGPFIGNRIIDLSYTAALKLGYLEKGSGMLEVERLLPDEILRLAQARRQPAPANIMAEEATGAEAMPVVQPATESGAIEVGAPLLVNPVATLPVNPRIDGQAIAAGQSPAPRSSVTPGEGEMAGAKSIYLQFGAFSQESNALAARGRLLQDLTGVIPALDAVVVDGLHRLHAGPYANRAAAQDALRLVQEKSALRPMIVER